MEHGDLCGGSSTSKVNVNHGYYPLDVYIANWKDPPCDFCGKIHELSTGSCSIAMFSYQRVIQSIVTRWFYTICGFTIGVTIGVTRGCNRCFILRSSCQALGYHLSLVSASRCQGCIRYAVPNHRPSYTRFHQAGWNFWRASLYIPLFISIHSHVHQHVKSLWFQCDIWCGNQTCLAVDERQWRPWSRTGKKKHCHNVVQQSYELDESMQPRYIPHKPRLF